MYQDRKKTAKSLVQGYKAYQDEGEVEDREDMSTDAAVKMKKKKKKKVESEEGIDQPIPVAGAY